MKKNFIQRSASLPKKASVFFTLILLLSFQSNAQVQTLQPVYTKVSNYIKGYYESLPVNYASQPSKKFPLLIFIHGKGEIGDGSASQLPKVANGGIARMIKQGTFPSSFTVNGETHSFLVICPQITTNAYTAAPAFITELLEFCKKKYRIDEDRIYITGLSMGGGMTWRAIGAHAGLFAAAVPICGSASSSVAEAQVIADNHLPVWATHNDGDATVNVSVTKSWYNKLVAAKTTPSPRMTIFASTSHDAWSKTYGTTFKEDGKNIYEWMLSYKRNNNSTPVVVSEPPFADAGADQIITLPVNSVTLNGSRSGSASGSIVSYAWSKIAGPTQGTIANAASASTTASGLVEGVYQFQLKVTDNAGKTSTDTLQVTVKPALIAPTTEAGNDISITLPVNNVALSGDNSIAGSGTIKSYAWTKVSGPASASFSAASSATTKVSNLVEGTYVFRLTVTNSYDLKSTDDVTVTVKPEPLPPVANAGINQNIQLPLDSVMLIGSQSVAYSGSIKTYSWSQLSGPSQSVIVNKNAAVARATGLVEGIYKFQLTVTDNIGKSATSTVTIAVEAAPLPPVADAGANQNITLPANIITLDGSKSVAPGDKIVSYQWTKTFGGAATITSPNAAQTTVTGLVAGNYSFTLTVTNSKQISSSATIEVSVIGAPISNAGADQYVQLPNTTAKLNGTASKATVGRIISYKWTKIAGGAATIAQPDAATTDITGLSKGSYKFSLLVISDNGKRSTDTVDVYVVDSTIATPIIIEEPPVQAPEPQVTNAPITDAGADEIITLPANSVTLNGSASKATVGRIISYEWKKISGGAATIEQPSSAITTVSGLTAGVYEFSLRVTSDNGRRTTDTVKVTVKQAAVSSRISAPVEEVNVNLANINTLKAKTEISLYPNPAVNDLTVNINSGSTGKTTIQLYDLSGKVLMQQQFNKTDVSTVQKKFLVNQLPAGIYIIKLVIGNEVSEVSKFVKK